MAQHASKKIRHNGRRIEIDTAIVPLIKEIWKTGIETGSSCENNQDGYVSLSFSNFLYVQDFVGIVETYAPRDVVKRVRQGLNCMGRKAEGGAWYFSIYSTYASDLFGGGKPSDRPLGFRYSHFIPTVRFPHADHEAVLTAMRQANADLLNDARKTGAA